jgi:hypothetical protein
VCIDLQQWEYFANFNKKFDIIIANLPQKIIYNKVSSIGVFWWKNWNEILLNFLSITNNYMTKKTRVYIFIYTLIDYIKTLEYITNNFKIKLINIKLFSEKIINENLEFYLNLNKSWKIYIKKTNRWYKAIEFLFELKLK